jgi:hypothetical protein
MERDRNARWGLSRARSVPVGLFADRRVRRVEQRLEGSLPCEQMRSSVSQVNSRLTLSY